MPDTSTSKQALRQARRQADLAVARSLAALCYGKGAGAADVKELSQLVFAAVEHRRGVEVRHGKHHDPRAVPSAANADSPLRPMDQIVQVTGQTRALRPPKETPSLASLRQRLSAS